MRGRQPEKPMAEIDRFLAFVATGAALGALFALIRYGRAVVDLLVSIDRKLDGRG
jgi:hypothetical protein